MRTLRELADRIERAPFKRVTESVALIAASVEPLKGIVERAIGRGRDGV